MRAQERESDKLFLAESSKSQKETERVSEWEKENAKKTSESKRKKKRKRGREAGPTVGERLTKKVQAHMIVKEASLKKK